MQQAQGKRVWRVKEPQPAQNPSKQSVMAEEGLQQVFTCVHDCVIPHCIGRKS